MERLWSPWRMAYIQANKAEPAERGCVFCALLDGSAQEDRILRRDEHAFVTLAKFPYNAEENAGIAALVQRGVRALREASEPHGFNVGLNLGHVAGAGIPEHLHWHVVPRWGGDTNFMPVVAETRVLPELIAESFETLAPLFEDR
jgi:ATP adenylyltransferase